MGLNCLFGHKWDGCKCFRCGKVRDEQHDWDLCRGVCRRCRKTCNEQHKWDGCNCLCCGKTHDKQHNWTLLENKCMEKCSICGKERNIEHGWNGCTCERCGKTRDKEHSWEKSVKNEHIVECSVCGNSLMAHNWEPAPTEEDKCLHQCSICGAKAMIHKGKCKCKVCKKGIPVYYAHDWEHWSEGLYGQHHEKKCKRCGMKYQFNAEATNIGTNVQIYEWSEKSDDGTTAIGYHKYVQQSNCYDKNSENEKGYYIMNLRDSSQNMHIATKLVTKK